jgi:hypothetical protein
MFVVAGGGRDLQRLLVEFARRSRALLLTVAQVDRELLVVLHEVDGDGGVCPPRRRALAAIEGHFNRVGLRHVQHFVGERLDLVA